MFYCVVNVAELNIEITNMSLPLHDLALFCVLCPVHHGEIMNGKDELFAAKKQVAKR